MISTAAPVVRESKQLNGRQTECRIYDSLEAFVDYIREGKQNGTMTYSDSFRDSSWMGRGDLSDWDSVFKAVNSEWRTGIQRIEQVISKLDPRELPKPTSRKRKPRWREDQGDEVCHDRLRSGQEFWRESGRVHTRAPKNVTIISDIGTRGHYEASQVLWRGAVSIILVKLLEDAGYRVELWGASNATIRQMRSFDAVCLKKTSQPVDLGSMVNASSAWFFRSMVFGARCSQSNRYSVGGSHPVSAFAGWDMVTQDANKLIVDEIWDEDHAVRYLKQALKNWEEHGSLTSLEKNELGEFSSYTV